MASEHPPGTGVRVQLSRDLGLFEVTMIGLGPTIGSTLFLMPGLGFQIVGPGLILAFVLNFAVTIFTAMAYMELSSAYPETGGGFLWVKEAFPHPFGFLGGWMSWFGHCIVATFYILGFGFGIVWLLEAYGLPPNVPTDLLRIALAVSLGALFIAINYIGVRMTGRAEGWITVALMALVAVLLAFGLPKALTSPDLVSHLTPFFREPAVQQLLVAMGFTFIVFEGYEIIAQTGEECKEPEKTIPRAHILCIGIATVIFVLLAFATVGTLGEEASSQGERAVAEMAIRSIPSVGIFLVVAGVVLGSVAALNSMIFSSSRVSFAMGRDGALPQVFGRLHERRRTPHVAIFTSGAIIITLTVALPLQVVAAAADIMFLLLFLFVNAAAIRLRIKHPEVRRAYKMPWFPVVPLIGIGTKFLLAISLYLYDPLAWYVAAFWIAFGLLLYYFYRGRQEIVHAPPAPRVDVLEVIARPVPSAAPAKKGFTVLLPMADFSDEELVRFAALAARSRGGELILLHVVEVPSTLPPKALRFNFVDERIKALERLERVARREGVETDAVLRISHRVYESILEVASEHHVDLLVLGWRGKRPTEERRILGSNIDYLIQKASCDVAVFKTAGLDAGVDEILLVAGDPGHGKLAAELAGLVAQARGARVRVLTIAERPEDEAAAAQQTAVLVDILRRMGVDHTQVAAKGKPMVQGVLDATSKSTLLVLGASEQWRMLRYAMGPSEDRIVRLATCPVLMLRRYAPTASSAG